MGKLRRRAACAKTMRHYSLQCAHTYRRTSPLGRAVVALSLIAVVLCIGVIAWPAPRDTFLPSRLVVLSLLDDVDLGTEAFSPEMSAIVENWSQYCHLWGYSLFLHTTSEIKDLPPVKHEDDHGRLRRPTVPMLHQTRYQLALISKYLVSGYDFVVWIAPSVFFQRFQVPLHSFIVDDKCIVGSAAGDSEAAVLQRRTAAMGGATPPNVVDITTEDQSSLVCSLDERAIIFRATDQAHNLVQKWAAALREASNPDSTGRREWASVCSSSLPHDTSAMHVHPRRLFLSDGHDSGRQSVLQAVEGPLASLRFARSYAYSYSGPHVHSFQDSFVYNRKALEQVRERLRHSLRTLSTWEGDVAIKDEVRVQTQACLTNALKHGYTPFSYDVVAHRYTIWWELMSSKWVIPRTIYQTVPSMTQVSTKILANLETWRTQNPSYVHSVYQDVHMEALLKDFLDVAAEDLTALRPVQRADIFRYLVVYLFGGFYADADTVCKKPIVQWPFAKSDTAVLGVEAQNVNSNVDHGGEISVFLAQWTFGAAPGHPALALLLRNIQDNIKTLKGAAGLSKEERLRHVLRTTGPVALTNAMATYFCYAGVHKDSMQVGMTPSALWSGGRAGHTRVFGIEGFGAGQSHSKSPSVDSEGVLAHHQFYASKEFTNVNKKWFE